MPANENDNPSGNSSIPKNSGSQSKLYIIYLEQGSQEEGVFVEELERIDFNGIQCFSGKYARINVWCSGKKLYIPIDKVKLIIEFDSLKEYEDKHKEQQAK